MAGSSEQKRRSNFDTAIQASGLSIIIISGLALAGWISGHTALASIYSRYIPMAMATCILSLFFGIFLLIGAYSFTGKYYRAAVISMLIVFSSYALCKFLEYFIRVELTLDNLVFPIKDALGRSSMNRSSPISGLLFFICGITALIKMYGGKRLVYLNTVCGLGLLILFSGFTGVIGYLHDTPLFYGSRIIPVSFPTTLVFLLLGIGFIGVGGSRTFLLKPLTKDIPSSRLLRAILPVVILSLLADDILNLALTRFFTVTPVFISASLALVIVPLSAWVTVSVSKLVFRRADVAELGSKKAEADLQSSELRHRSMLENLGEGAGLVDPDEMFVFSNPAAERIFGVYPNKLHGHNLKEFLLPEQLPGLLAETEKRTNAIQSTYELDIIRPDKKVRNLLVTATPQVNSQGTFTGTFGVFRDISEKKEIDAKLEKFAKDLQESNATKDKFFSIIAHDLKGPFNAILGLSNLLVTQYHSFDPQEIEDTLNTIKKSSEKAFELVENLLVWASSQTGQIPFDPQVINLSNIIKGNIALLEPQAFRKNIRIQTNCPPDLRISGDKQMISTVLRNLVSNAIKFTPGKGEVHVNVHKSDGQVTVSVKDTGVGIRQNDIPKLFRVDSKYSTSGTENEKGTGLGLILCKEFIERHKGIIWAESTEGKGSTFNFSIPQT
ncbi:MAG: PAS domain-containing sensor histidine kinase [Bacteroidota bacterium]